MRMRNGIERSRRTPRGEYFETMSASAKADSVHDSVFVAGRLLHDGSRPGAVFAVSESFGTFSAALASGSLTPCSYTSRRTSPFGRSPIFTTGAVTGFGGVWLHRALIFSSLSAVR